MSEELQPGLGSGALREALDKVIEEYFGEDWRPELTDDLLAAALSLSSPIEPAPACTDKHHGIRLTAKGRELLEQIIEEERKENPEGVARIEAILALAPSRQGAATRVEG